MNRFTFVTTPCSCTEAVRMTLLYVTLMGKENQTIVESGGTKRERKTSGKTVSRVKTCSSAITGV